MEICLGEKTSGLSAKSRKSLEVSEAGSPPPLSGSRSGSPASSGRFGRLSYSRRHHSDSDFYAAPSLSPTRSRSLSASLSLSAGPLSVVLVRAAFLAAARASEPSLRTIPLLPPLLPSGAPRDPGILHCITPPHPASSTPITLRSLLAFRSLSTYPKIGVGAARSGDPVADAGAARLSGGRAYLALADGCGWGQAAAAAARTAVGTFVREAAGGEEAVARGAPLLVDDATHIVLDAFYTAHQAVCLPEHGASGVCGTTTLAGGILTCLAGEEEAFVFVHASVGDVRIFVGQCPTAAQPHWKLVSLSESVTTKLDVSTRIDDCGGRIGPYTEGKADLRNLSAGTVRCKPGDVILLMSDGVDDNLDPQRLGLSVEAAAQAAGVPMPEEDAAMLAEVAAARAAAAPRESEPAAGSTSGLCFKGWHIVNGSFARKVKMAYRSKILGRCIEETNAEPAAMVRHLLRHAAAVTAPSRAFMESSGRSLPEDYHKYPGKMDHASVLACKVPQHVRELETGVQHGCVGAEDVDVDAAAEVALRLDQWQVSTGSVDEDIPQ